MHPILLSLGPWKALWSGWEKPLELHTYGMMIAIGFIVGMWVATREAKRIGVDHNRILDLLFYILLAGLVGSRIVFIMVNWRDYAARPGDILAFWRGGLVWYGGFIGALVFTVWYTHRHKMNILQTIDIIVPSVAIGHAFGRIGCVFAGCCFGNVTTWPLGIIFPVDSMAHAEQLSHGLVAATALPLPVHPTQLYESTGEVLIFFMLMGMRHRKRFHGQLLLTYMIVYPILRSCIEMARGDKARGFIIDNVLSTSQFISILVAIGAAVLFYYLHRRSAELTKESSTAK